MAHLLKFVYQLRVHCLGQWPLDRWAVTLAWGWAVVLWLGWLLRGRPALAPWHWGVLALLGLVGAGLLALRFWGERHGYALFVPEGRLARPTPCALAPEDKVPLWATGHFGVEGRSGFFAGLQAYWRTFATREHAVMAIRHRSRFLLVGKAPDKQIGMWYIFIPAERVERVTPGRIAFGGISGPGLRLEYRRPPEAQAVRRFRFLGPAQETVYLRFADESARVRVWADLLARSR
ncbi:MAG: hypothetical protein ACUVR4_01360 [Anaerolineae bacterium]